ncbi:hypothetical protein VP01_762g1 [Puccinia sorghi]|uniref:Uncharacterized protein n=1 Tax=Puccinia sorghi TaxID=27349 RepID=A0A0L6UBS7_9BASI|nr:hypothetical protein VP01_762g1 [Puccinia sorghi]
MFKEGVWHPLLYQAHLGRSLDPFFFLLGINFHPIGHQYCMSYHGLVRKDSNPNPNPSCLFLLTACSSNNSSFLGASAYQLQAVEQFFFAVVSAIWMISKIFFCAQPKFLLSFSTLTSFIPFPFPFLSHVNILHIKLSMSKLTLIPSFILSQFNDLTQGGCYCFEVLKSCALFFIIWPTTFSSLIFIIHFLSHPHFDQLKLSVLHNLFPPNSSDPLKFQQFQQVSQIFASGKIHKKKVYYSHDSLTVLGFEYSSDGPKLFKQRTREKPTDTSPEGIWDKKFNLLFFEMEKSMWVFFFIDKTKEKKNRGRKNKEEGNGVTEGKEKKHADQRLLICMIVLFNLPGLGFVFGLRIQTFFSSSYSFSSLSSISNLQRNLNLNTPSPPLFFNAKGNEDKYISLNFDQAFFDWLAGSGADTLSHKSKAARIEPQLLEPLDWDKHQDNYIWLYCVTLACFGVSSEIFPLFLNVQSNNYQNLLSPSFYLSFYLSCALLMWNCKIFWVSVLGLSFVIILLTSPWLTRWFPLASCRLESSPFILPSHPSSIPHSPFLDAAGHDHFLQSICSCPQKKANFNLQSTLIILISKKLTHHQEPPGSTTSTRIQQPSNPVKFSCPSPSIRSTPASGNSHPIAIPKKNLSSTDNQNLEENLPIT